MNEAIKQYKEARDVANTEITGDRRTQAGREMVRRQAQAALPALYQKVTSDFKNVGFAVFVDGPSTQAFVDKARELADLVVVDFGKATASIKGVTVASMGTVNQEFSPSAFTVMLREIKQLAADMGLASIPDVAYDGPVPADTPELVSKVVDGYLMKYLGADFVAHIIEHAAMEQVLNLTTEAGTVPVIVLNFAPEFRGPVTKFLFIGKSLNVSATSDKDITNDFVTQVFKAVKQSKK